MRILLTNDDGIMAEGIYMLAKELEKEYDVTIVAPESQKSAQSHAITLHQPLIIKEVKLDGLKSKAYSISGTPADCVRAGIEAIVEDKIDLVFSGINLGLNSGMDIIYSGTVSAAVEANIYNIPSIAVSAEWMQGTANYKIAAKYAIKVLKQTQSQLLKSNIVLNLNTPYNLNDVNKELKICTIGGAILDYYFIEEQENGERTLTIRGRRETELEEGTDRYCLSKGYATLTPLRYDLNNLALMDTIKEWFK
ncbi:5'/3'-nucleotidase SurE [Tissierella sp. Yu-01]|uniref:5'/3'-nucleotidase SurE n=1 Tax=Tissierella sp. Yu-01 TaxID=3035694 RepID=UPI00240DF185|nr:5'/3'-nucleotidase SurE [Tissierella sp. Yu-01]WFA08291.1 5'/3'-nucleotidase SurE [Tissierella sp. Yu-01]